MFGKELYFYEPKSLIGWIAYFFIAPMIVFLAVVAIATFLGLAAKQKQCRSCRSTIAREVIVCPFCGSRT